MWRTWKSLLPKLLEGKTAWLDHKIVCIIIEKKSASLLFTCIFCKSKHWNIPIVISLCSFYSLSYLIRTRAWTSWISFSSSYCLVIVQLSFTSFHFSPEMICGTTLYLLYLMSWEIYHSRGIVFTIIEIWKLLIWTVSKSLPPFVAWKTRNK